MIFFYFAQKYINDHRSHMGKCLIHINMNIYLYFLNANRNLKKFKIKNQGKITGRLRCQHFLSTAKNIWIRNSL